MKTEKVPFLTKNADFLQKNAGIGKIKKTLVLKDTKLEFGTCVPNYKFLA